MRARGWKTSRGKAAKNVDLIKILLAWMAAYGSLILFMHIYSHTGKGGPLSVGQRIVLLLATITNSVQFRIAHTARLIIW